MRKKLLIGAFLVILMLTCTIFVACGGGKPAEHTHTYGEWQTVAVATCTAEGSRKKVCSCGNEITESISKIDHAYGEWQTVTPANCTAEGLKKKVCSCGDEVTESISKVDHAYGEWQTVTEATCAVEGKRIKVCFCGHEFEESIPKISHTYGDWQWLKENGASYNVKECVRCLAKDKVLVTGGLKYDGGTVTGTGSAPSLGKIVIPFVNEKNVKVTSIGYRAFAWRGGLTSITIPSSVTSIGDSAFAWCYGLTSITIPSSVTSIGDWAFSECSWLKSITVQAGNIVYHSQDNCIIETATKTLISGFKNSVIPTDGSVTSIGQYAFYDCSELTSIIIPEGVTSIGNYAFYDCSGLTSITIPSGVTSIGNYAFYDCSGLTSITIPSGVTSIGNYAFYDCSGLTSITIPSSVTSIGEEVFSGCSGLESITVQAGNAKYHSRGNCIIETATKTLILGCKTSVIPTDGSVTSIGSSAFHGSGLINITIPSSVISIGWGAFSFCSGLESIAVQAGNAKYYSKDDCIIETAKKTLIAGCKNSVIPTDGSVTSIGDGAFAGCSGLTSITIPSSVTSIGSSAFHDSGLINITIPSSVKIMGMWAVDGCSGLTIYCEAESVPSDWDSNWNESSCPVVWDYKNNDVDVDGYAYTVIDGVVYQLKDNLATVYDCSTSVTEVNISSAIEYKGTNYSVTSIGEDAFSGCSKLTRVNISDIATWCKISFYSYDSNPLYYAEKLYLNGELVTDLVIPEVVTSIGSYAFSNCSGLTSITIPSGVTSIGSQAFSNCSGLTIYCEISKTEKPSGWHSYWNGSRPVVWNCNNNDKDANGYAYTVVNGVVYQLKDNLATVFDCSTSVTEVNISSAVEFKGTNYSVTSIGLSAFSSCSGLKSITIPSSVTSIGDWAFSSCSGLTSITISASITSIGNNAFYGCSRLTSITIPSSVTSIGGGAFWNCSGLESITVQAGNTKYHSQDNCLIETATKMLIAGCKNSVIPTDGSVTIIGDWAFDGCSGLTSITIPEGVTSIGDWAFAYCSGLENIIIPSSVTSIGNNAFYNCSGLTRVNISDIAAWCKISFSGSSSNPLYYANNLYLNGELVTDLVIPEVVTSIGSYAFYNCSGLTSITMPSSVTSIGDAAFSGCSGLTSITMPSGVTSIGNNVFFDDLLIIYCEAESQPSGWDSDWNYINCPVVWGYKG